MQRPEVVVAAIIFNVKREVLLCKSAKWNNKYVVPGGHVEIGETLEEALIREVKEETNLEVYDVSLVALKESIQEDLEKKKERGVSAQRHYIVFDYVCQTKDTHVTLNHEASDYVWCALSEVFSYDLDPYTYTFFKAYRDDHSTFKKVIIYNA
jgi:nucleoside triphosphatase